MLRSRHSAHRNPTATASADTRCEQIQPANWERWGTLDRPTNGISELSRYVAHHNGRRLRPALLKLGDMTTESIAAAKAMAEWLQDKSFSILNVHNYPNFHHHIYLPTQYAT